MTVLSAQSIRARGIFTPFHERTVSSGMTFGLGPAGYDVRIAETVTLGFHEKAPGMWRNNLSILASTMEHFNMPDDCLAYVKDKSTWARKFVLVQNTVIEPGWRGHLTLEITYEGEQGSLTITEGTPIAQIIFHKLDEPTEKPYSGKYQDQAAGPQPAILEN
ncbi:deoxycytidine triphosphate deaminase [Brucella sp. TWI432]